MKILKKLARAAKWLWREEPVIVTTLPSALTALGFLTAGEANAIGQNVAVGIGAIAAVVSVISGVIARHGATPNSKVLLRTDAPSTGTVSTDADGNATVSGPVNVTGTPAS